MIAIINGEEGSSLQLFKGATTMARLLLLSDGNAGPTGQVTPVGTPLDVTGDTVTLEVYDTQDRRNAVVASIAATIVTATAGYLTISISSAQASFGPGTYYGYVKRNENTGTTIEFGRKFLTMVVS